MFQTKTHKLIEELRGVETVDDFVAIGFGDTMEDAAVYHKILRRLLQRFKEQNVTPNSS